MTYEARVLAVSGKGFTDRQARFLVTVMLHAGVCMVRQYCAFARISHGQKTHDFFASLVERRVARAYACAHKRARIFHVHHRALYEAIGEPHSRFRKPTPIGPAIHRLMLLDAVLASPTFTWLATERDKLAYFTMLLGDRLRREDYPRLRFGEDASTTVRYFPDRLPIGHDAERRTHVFVYLVARSVPVDFRAFLHRHAELLRALPSWTVRLLLPAHLRANAEAYVAAFHQELATPIRPAISEELAWFFEQRARSPQSPSNGIGYEEERLERARRAFGAPRYRVLYRSWRREGRKVLDATVSPVLADTIKRGAGRIESDVLPHAYLHLSPLVGTA